MSSFVTNAATRRGKRTRYGTTAQNTQSSLASLTDSTINTHLNIADTIRPKLRHAVIGNETSNGLTIQGTHEFPRMGASNPDNRTIPLGTSGERSDGAREDHLNRPEFPVRLNARGILTFPDPIKIKAIEGDLEVKGTLSAKTITGTTSSTSFTPVLEDDIGNLATLTTASGLVTTVGDLVFLQISLIWSASAIASAGKIQIIDLPAMKEGTFLIHAVKGLAVNNVGAHFIGVINNDGDTIMSLHEVNNTTFAAQSFVTGAQHDVTGQLIVNGMGVLT